VLVNVGSHDFPCGRRETPHFLEHLIFAGTRTHTEEDLDTAIRNQGGDWNAYTGAKATWYAVEMYSGRYRLGLRLMHEMLSEPLLETGSVETSRKIIQRESGEEEGLLREWMYSLGIGKSATVKALEAFGHECPALETPRHITRGDIVATWRQTYVASNMAVIMVGHFARDEALREIRRTFGRMPVKPAPVQRPLEYRLPPRPLRVEATLHQLLGTEANLRLGFRTVGHRSKDRAVLRLLEGHLDEVLYQQIRVEKGLSYTPFAASEQYQDAGILYLGTDSALHTVEETLTEMRRQVRHLLEHPLEEDEVEAWKDALLAGDARGLETNAEHADWYLMSLDDLANHGHFIDDATAIRDITAADVNDAAHRYLDLDHAVTVVEAPALGYRRFLQWMLGLGVMAVLLTVLGIRRYRQKRSGKLITPAIPASARFMRH
jgi:predicted Zn-dependent peptidase